MFPSGFYGPRYFAPRYFPRNGGVVPPIPPTPDAGGSSGAGRPWPQRALSILLPYRVWIDDEDVLFIIDD